MDDWLLSIPESRTRYEACRSNGKNLHSEFYNGCVKHQSDIELTKIEAKSFTWKRRSKQCEQIRRLYNPYRLVLLDIQVS